MSIEDSLKGHAAVWLASESKLNISRAGARFKRKLFRRKPAVHYVHRVDDPYSHLMVQALPEFLNRFPDVELVIHVVERLPAVMYPDPARYEAHSIMDSQRLARLFGLDMPDSARVPDRLSVQMVSHHLAALSNPESFLQDAVILGEAVWRGDVQAVRANCAIAEMTDAPIRASEQKLRDLGGYASATLFFEGETYTGIERLYHLEARLAAEGLGHAEPRLRALLNWRDYLSDKRHLTAGKSLEVYFSIRSPFSYLALHELSDFASLTGAIVKLRPVMPLVMQGVPVPPLKLMTLFRDAAREGRAQGIPFVTKRFYDPLGEATIRGLKLGLSITNRDQTLAFYRSYTAQIWQGGGNAMKDQTLVQALSDAGLTRGQLKQALSNAELEAQTSANLQRLNQAGLWGVPSFIANGQAFFGQDRLRLVGEALVGK